MKLKIRERTREVAMEEKRKWEELRTDCLVEIFSKLSMEDLTLGVPFVCKPWLHASLHPQCWKVLNFQGLDLMPWSSFNAQFKQKYGVGSFSFAGLMKLVTARGRGSAVELAFPDIPAPVLGPSLPDFIYASIQCPRLKVLALPNIPFQDEKHIPELIGKWKELEYLKLGRKPSSFLKILEQISLNCNNFVGLQVHGCFNHQDVMAIVGHLPKLKHLVVSGSSLRKDVLLAILDEFKQLQSLDVKNCKGFAIDDEILKKGSRLQVFDCTGAKLEEEYCYDLGGYDDVHGELLFLGL